MYGNVENSPLLKNVLKLLLIDPLIHTILSVTTPPKCLSPWVRGDGNQPKRHAMHIQTIVLVARHPHIGVYSGAEGREAHASNRRCLWSSFGPEYTPCDTSRGYSIGKIVLRPVL